MTGLVLLVGAAAADRPPAAVTATLPAPDRERPPVGPGGGDGLGASGVVRGHGRPGVVAFTFDDGPSAHTPRVLAALAARDVPAAFFIVGKSLTGSRGPRARAILGDIVARGHDVGNHTFGHQVLTGLADADRDHQIDANAALIAEILGRAPTMIRPPYGERSDHLDQVLAARGLTQLLWSIDPRDWDTDGHAELRKRVVDQVMASGGGIVVLHDTKPDTVAALPGILADLEAANCRRIRRGRPPVLPVSLHYFMVDGTAARPVPAAIAERTQRYRDALTARCAPRQARPGS